MPKYQASEVPQATDSLFFAEEVYRYMKFKTPYSVKFCLAGFMSYIVNNQLVTVPSGSYYVTNKDTELECLPALPGIKAVAVYFTPRLLADVVRFNRSEDMALLDDPAFYIEPIPFFENIYHRPGRLSQHLLSVAALMKKESCSDNQIDSAILYELAEGFYALQWDAQQKIDRINARTPATKTELYRRVIAAHDFMLDQWETQLSLEEVAQNACLSTYHFHRTFNEVFGMPPMHWFKMKKMERAKELLVDGKTTVSEAAIRCGFADVSGFSKAFKRVCGKCPSEVG